MVLCRGKVNASWCWIQSYFLNVTTAEDSMPSQAHQIPSELINANMDRSLVMRNIGCAQKQMLHVCVRVLCYLRDSAHQCSDEEHGAYDLITVSESLYIVVS